MLERFNQNTPHKKLYDYRLWVVEKSDKSIYNSNRQIVIIYWVWKLWLLCNSKITQILLFVLKIIVKK